MWDMKPAGSKSQACKLNAFQGEEGFQIHDRNALSSKGKKKLTMSVYCFTKSKLLWYIIIANTKVVHYSK